MNTSASPLYPDHLADLRKSGLTGETITAMGIYSVPPADIARMLGFNPQQVQSALAFPYPGTEGFIRLKVFPPYQDESGHAVKYLQPKGTTPHLYILPAVEAILTNLAIPLTVVEGEKKTAALIQAGVNAVGVGGVWAWVESETHALIPEMDYRIAWFERVVELVFDSDIWHRPDLLNAVYALGKELEDRGAKIFIVVIEQQGTEKVGIDDFLVARGVEALSGLKRAPLAHTAFSESKKWWKRWRSAKQKDGSVPTSIDNCPYRETRSGIMWGKHTSQGEIPVPLTNFTAKIVADVVRDDGAERETAFEIQAAQGERTVTFTIPAARFGAMNWPTEYLGAEAIVYPGTTVKDHARAAVQMLSPKPIPRRTTYTHTGWRKIGDGYVYLHGKGAIGAAGHIEGVQVELPGVLARYELPEPAQGDTLRAAIRASLGLLALAEDAIALPMFCAIYRSAVGSCDFSVHLAGPTGVFKSELAALCNQHYGAAMDRLNLPGSWHSTDNALEGLLFAAKDALTVLDDFAPCGGPYDVARWHQRADRIIRAQGNNAGRSRMRADGTLRPPKPPRGLALSTGEDVPKGQSLRARLLILELTTGTIAPDALTRCQQDARSGLYAAAMAGFVRWLASQYEQVRQSVRADVEILRQQAVGADSHCRTPEIVANLALGLRYFIAFAKAEGVMTETEGQALWQRGWTALGQAGSQQADHQAANEPARRFIELLLSAIASGHAHLADHDGNTPNNAGAWGWRLLSTGTGEYAREEWKAHGDRIGWVDGPDVLLDPDASYRAAQSMAGINGDALSISAQTLRKRLHEKGMVIRQSQDSLLSRRVLQGNMRKVLQLAPGLLSEKTDISDISIGSSPQNGPEDVGNDGNDGKHQGETPGNLVLEI